MAFLEKADLYTVMYQEDIDAITEGDDDKVTSLIKTGIAEAQGYLDRYDIDVLFARTGDARDPILFESIKAIVVWYLVAACPANQNTKDTGERATAARTWLRRVQRGELRPVNWPPKAPTELSTFFHVSSNPKRGNHF